jgi:hypothetical protein
MRVYNSILLGDASAIIGFGPNYYMILKIESLINSFSFNGNPYNMLAGIAAISIQKLTTAEEWYY